MSTIATICARGGSKGLPGKNIKPLLGKPLIVYTIEQALQCQKIDAVYVSTDDRSIAKIAEEAGAVVPFLRPEVLAASDTPKIPVIQHLVAWLEENSNSSIDKIVDLDPTSPLRDVNDINSCITLLKKDMDVVITGYESLKNPYFNMVERQLNGGYGLVKKLAKDQSPSCRQTMPKVYSMNASIYVWHRASLNKGLWDGKVMLYEMPQERSIDIDTLLDFKFVEMLMKEKNGILV